MMTSLVILIISFIIYSQLVGKATRFYFPHLFVNIRYPWPIGFFIILGLLQFISFPLQTLHVSMKVVSLCYGSVFLILSLFIIYYLYRIYRDKPLSNFKVSKDDLIEYGLIGLFIGIHFLICFFTNSFNDTNADQSFYITLVENNMDATQINGILPLSGKIGWLESYYNFQSFYLFLTFIATTFNLEAILVMAWFVPILLWLTVAMTFLNVINYFKNLNPSRKKISIFIILWAFSSMFDYFVRYNCYGNNIRLFVFAYLMLFYLEYFKRPCYQTLFLCGILWASACSFQSTALFLGIMLIVAIGIYELFVNRKALIIPLIFSSIPLLIYIAFFLSHRVNIWLGIGSGIAFLVFVLLLLNKSIKLIISRFFYSQFFRGFIIVSVLGMMYFSMKMLPVLNEEVTISPTYFIEFLFNKYAPRRSYIVEGNWSMFLLAFIRDGLFLYYLGLLTKYRRLSIDLKFILTVQLIIIVVFYNPIVSPFVSTYFTGSVYMRTGDIVMSVFLITATLSYWMQKKKSKYVIMILSCLSAYQLLVQTHQYFNHDFNLINQESNFNHLYRMNQDIVDTAHFIESYIDEYYQEERPKVLTPQLELNYFAHNYEMIYTVNEERRVFDESYRQQKSDVYLLRDGLKRSYDLSVEDQEEFKRVLKQYQPNLIVLPQIAAPWVHDLLNKQASKINENSTYSVYQY